MISLKHQIKILPQTITIIYESFKINQNYYGLVCVSCMFENKPFKSFNKDKFEFLMEIYLQINFFL